jgi:GAF domain-containing protein
VKTVGRLLDIARLGLDREAERGHLQDIVQTVSVRLDTPFALIDVLLDDAQVILAGFGATPAWVAEVGGTPIEWAFCTPLIEERAPRVVPDLTADPMFRDNPLVTVEGVRSYIGAPLISYRGHVLGGICGLDVRTREFTSAEIDFLQGMAAETVERLETYAGPE